MRVGSPNACLQRCLPRHLLKHLTNKPANQNGFLAVQSSSKAPNGVEILPLEITVLNMADQPLPMDPTEKVKAGIDTRLDSRFLDIRKDNVSAIFKIKGQMFHTIRDFFYDNGFYEINTPKLVASATEGGTELFPIA